jgi:uncharacterized repeat protein (TIGR01451 family)
MKHTYLFLVLFSAMASAQVINFPDINFKNALLSSSSLSTIATDLSGAYIAIDANNDGEIDLNEAAAVKYLFVTSYNITSIEGINGFSNLEQFNAVGNNIASLSISNLTHLQAIDVSASNISSISLTNLPAFGYLTATNNQLASLNISACPQLSQLVIYGNLLTSIDVSGFNELTVLKVGQNLLTSLDVSGLTALTILSVGDNQLTSLNLSGATALTGLDLGNGNILTSLDASSCTLLQNFNAGGSQIGNANFSGCAQLLNLYLANNSVTGLNITGCTALKYLTVGTSAIPSTFSVPSLEIQDLPALQTLFLSGLDISTLSVSNCPALQTVGVNWSQFTSVSIHNCQQLLSLDCSNCPLLSALSVSSCPHLQNMDTSFSALTTLDVSGFTELESLSVHDNVLTNLNVANCSALAHISAKFNQLALLDISTCTSLESCDISYNPITAIYAKNGRDETLTFFPMTPNLAFICADESQLAAIQNTLNTNNISGVVVNSYCSFTPGGNYNTITGTAHFDADNNGCSASDPVLPYLKLKLNDGTTDSGSLTNNLGAYSFYTQAGSFTIAPDFENASFFTVSPSSATTSFADNNTNSFAQDFCLAANGVHPDLEVTLVPSIPATPGFDAVYQIVYKNKGNQPLTGVLNFTFDDSVLDYVNASVIPDAQATGLLSFDYADLLPFEARIIYITLNANAPTEIPAVNNGDILAFTASGAVTSDETPADNSSALSQVVVGAFDPNDKNCLEGEAVSTTEIGNYLHYVIHFQNTGTAAAQNVVVSDIIDTTKFDISTLQLVNTSHPAQIRVTGNKAEFIFEGIQLAEQEHGEVVFKIKTLPTLPEGTTVTNQADIYFDYNFPVETNTASTAFSLLSAHDFGNVAEIRVYPNPATNLVNIEAKSAINSVTLYDLQGRLVSVNLPVSPFASVDVSNLQAGIYFVTIKTAGGSITKKIEKK